MKIPDYVIILEKLAIKYHKGQMYGEVNYIYHVNAVATETAKILIGRKIEKYSEEYWRYIGVALGHDLVEDTDITLKILEEILIPKEVIDGIDSITKRKGESKKAYINRVMFNKYSHLVKQADSTCNLIESIRVGHGRRIRKYTEYLSLLAAEVMYVFKDSPNQSRVKFISNDIGSNGELEMNVLDIDNNCLTFDAVSLELVGALQND